MYFLSLKIVFIIANSADPGKISHYVPFHQGLYCLLKYLLWKKKYGVQPHEMYKKQKKIFCKEFIKLYCFREDVSSSLKVLVKCILVSPIRLSEVFHINSLMYLWPCCNTQVLTDSVSQSFLLAALSPQAFLSE